jgi:hypothetical protein
VSSARVALQQALQQKIQGDLSKAGQPGEKMNDQIQWTVWSFTTTHSPGDQAPNFTATMELRGEGDFYRPDDVTAAFTAALKQKVPADKQLVGAVVPAYQVTPAAGGHLTFAGKANGFVAPKLDLQAIKGKVAGKSAAQARQNLKSLPVQSATIQQHPFKLPFMPLFTSRVKVDYQLVSPPATSPSPPPSH